MFTPADNRIRSRVFLLTIRQRRLQIRESLGPIGGPNIKLDQHG